MTQTPRTRSRSPEFRLALRAWQGLREDLLRAPFAVRPLPPLRTDGPVLGRLPERIREPARWSVHALVLGWALITFAIGYEAADDGIEGVIYGLCSAVPVALTLIRPVLAWWTCLLAALLTGGIGGFQGGWPWQPGSIAAVLVVMTVVAARTRPRTAAWMWVLATAYSLLVVAQGRVSNYTYNAPQVLIAAAFLLFVVSLVHTRRAGQREVVAQMSVTAVERDRRTLLEERTTIARELHDVVAHHMSVVAIQAEAAPYRVENPPPELEQAFATIRENAVAALTELRRVLGVVRASDYEAPDAPQPRLADLTRLLDNVRDTGLDVEHATTGAVRELPQGVELSAYRIVQEALSNVLRHAPGASARVEVGYVLGGLGLRVVNGPGTADAPPSPGAGHGVTGMRERVAMLDGEMTAEPTAEGGFEVTVFVPVATTAPETVRDAVPETVRDAVPGPVEVPVQVPPQGPAPAAEDTAPQLRKATP
ncbi:sensor histidine kinase [Streptomyces sp. NPDC021093]|uniref:sensor histidine kinase n=1 Tax=Streptomyces sp. NPDC021093 TaxID=3365112 RepID=UPI0037A5B75E